MAANTSPDDDTSPQSRWGRDFWEKYRELSTLVANLASHGSHSLIPAKQASAHLRQTEQQLTHVTGLLAPKRSEIADIWTEDVATVAVATQDNGQLVERDQALSLDTIADWTTGTTIVETSKPQRGAGSQQQPTQGFLPPAAIKQLFQQLTEGINRLGWMADAATQDYVAGEDEVFSHK